MAKFLDSNGLLYLWGKIKGLIPNKNVAVGKRFWIHHNV